jgi:site-specific DNA recombinase
MSKQVIRKALGYCRVSGEDQADRGTGLERQRENIKSWAAANACEIVQIFSEEGISGTKSGADRPAWRKMRAALLSDGIKTVIIEDLDRLARDLVVQEQLIMQLQADGFSLISIEEGDRVGSADPHDVFTRQIFGGHNQLVRAVIVKRLKDGRDRASRKLGRRCEGRKPFGQTDEEHAAIARMKALRSEGTPLLAIAATLNKEKHRPRAAKRWYASSVLAILRRTA